MDPNAIGFLTGLLENRKKESLKSYKAPNVLVSKIAFPENPDAHKDIFSGHQMQNLVAQSNQSGVEDLDDEDDLRGSQNEKF